MLNRRTVSLAAGPVAVSGRGQCGGPGTLGPMDGDWTGLVGVALGALITGGVTFLTGKLADDRARTSKRKEHVARLGAELLREADRVKNFLSNYISERGYMPGENEEWGHVDQLARIAGELRLFAPRSVNDVAAELVAALEAREAGVVGGRSRDVGKIRDEVVTALRVYLHGGDD